MDCDCMYTKAGDHSEDCPVVTDYELSRLRSEVEALTRAGEKLANALATERAAREEAESLLVWAMKRHAYTTIDGTVVIPYGGRLGHWTRVDTERDPARITAAVRSARTKGGE